LLLGRACCAITSIQQVETLKQDCFQLLKQDPYLLLNIVLELFEESSPFIYLCAFEEQTFQYSGPVPLIVDFVVQFSAILSERESVPGVAKTDDAIQQTSSNALISRTNSAVLSPSLSNSSQIARVKPARLRGSTMLIAVWQRRVGRSATIDTTIAIAN
jgi:hypothetical protein